MTIPGRRLWLLVAVAILLRLWLIARYPGIFGGDSVVRLANADRLFLSYQLPGLQAIVWLLEEPLWVRLAMAALGGLAAAGVYRLARGLLGPDGGLAAGLLFGTNAFIAAYSIVPYQEILMLVGLAFALAFYLERRPAVASIALGIACWTRYEAWLLCPLLLAADFFRGSVALRTVARSVLLWGWAPAAWIVVHAGLTPPGTYAVGLDFSFERFHRWLYLGWITLKNGWPLLPFAALGAVAFARKKLWRVPGYRLALAFLALFLVAILFSSHGERADPDRWVTAREAHIPLTATAFLAGLGWLRLGRFSRAALAGVVAVQIVAADRYVAAETAAPEVGLAYRAAEALDRHVGPAERVVMLAPQVPRAMLERFLETAEAQGGPAGRRRAVEMLLGLETGPPDYQRVLVQSRLGPDRLISFATFPEDLIPNQPPPPAVDPEWVLLWDGFAPSNQMEGELARRALAREPVWNSLGPEPGAMQMELSAQLFRVAP